MPVTASAAGLYLKGIAFSLSNTEPLAIIMVDDDIPLSLIILTSKKDIDEIISKCECIQPSKLDEWVMDLSQEWTQPAETS